MDTKAWIDNMERSGQVCPDYMRRLSLCTSRRDTYRVLCDANGGSWLFGLHARRVPLPIDAFMEEFKAYINGGEPAEYPGGWTSRLFCRHSGPVTADTTLLYLLECPSVQVTVPKNAYPSVILSRGTHAEIAMMPGSRLNIETYGDAVYSVSGDMSRVRTTKH